MVTGFAVSFLGPIFFQRSGDGKDGARNADVHELSWRITWGSLLVTLICFVITLFTHESLFRLLVAFQYRQTSYLFPWVVLAGGVFAAGQVLALKLLSEMKSNKMVMVKIFTALIGIVFNIYGALVAGLFGVVCSLVAFSVTYFFWMIWLAKDNVLIPDTHN
jgi:O-antigen/teichoic acid export membrane protein